jgi:hypothetical protein
MPKNRMRKWKVAMLTPAMLRRLLLALVAFSLVRTFAMADTHTAVRSKAATSVANGWIYG